jgi:beta-N-acetylhexosaminidase
VTELEIGDTGDPAVAERSARESAAALKGAGFDINLAPVADVATIASPIADRAYGDDPAVVAPMVVAALSGCGAAGIACAPSHFPGLGGASADTALGPAMVSLDATSMRLRDLEPFAAAFGAGAPAVVLSLAFYAAYDPATPAALSPAVATDLLRGELGYQGVAITDDLSSGAIAAGIGAPAAAVQALAAGSDMVLVGDPAQAAAARAAILEASRSGAIPAARLDEAVARVLTLKQGRGLFTG